MSSFETIEDLRSFIKDWNRDFPIDRWWREKYKVPFGSKAHGEVSFIDMRLAFEEDRMYEKESIEMANSRIEEKEVAVYEPGKGNWLAPRQKHKSVTKEEIDADFEKISNAIGGVSSIVEEKTEDGKLKISI